MASKTVSTASNSSFDRFVNYLHERAEVQEDAEFDGEKLSQQAVEQILEADDMDALFNAMKVAGLIGLRDLENGTILRIDGFRLVRGNLGIGVYAVIDATDVTTGEKLGLDTGVSRVLAFLRVAENLNAFPVTVQVSKKTTQSGNELVTLLKVPAHTVRSTAE